jgi:nitrogen fixation protein NifU and related proteins
VNNDQNFESLVSDLKKKIDKNHRQYFSATVIAEFSNPTHLKKMMHPDTSATIKGPCGDTMKIDLLISDGIIVDASFWTDGCGASIASGNMLTKQIIGKSLTAAQKLSSNYLLKSLDGLPPEHEHCTVLAVNTLRSGIKKYQSQLKTKD